MTNFPYDLDGILRSSTPKSIRYWMQLLMEQVYLNMITLVSVAFLKLTFVSNVLFFPQFGYYNLSQK